MTAFEFEDPASFEPTQLADVADPYPLFDALREQGPSVATTSGYHVVTGYETAEEVLRDSRFSSGEVGTFFRAALPEGAANDRLSNRINFMDPPEHTRVRGLVAKAFTPQRVDKLQPWIESKANELLDELEQRLAEGAESVDIRAEFAHKLPSAVISELLGVPVEDREYLTGLTEDVTPLLNIQAEPAERKRALEASEEFASYASGLIEQRQETPKDDLLSDMIHLREGEESLSHEQLESLFITLYSAGHRTTRDLFTNGLYTLLDQPETYEAIAENPNLVSTAVQEFLRYETPTLYVARVATEDIQLGEKTISNGTPTLVMLGAANRDPGTYTDPHSFDIHRDEAAPLSFASGRHRCLGAPLATMEAEVMLRALTDRFPRLAVADPEPGWWSSGPFRGLDHLRVRPS